MHKTYYTSARCPKCESRMKTSDLPEYSFLCEKCDENFYGIEVKGFCADFFEINIPVTQRQFELILPALNRNFNPDFIGYDDVAMLLDVGWSHIPANVIIHNVVNMVNEVIMDESNK